MLAEGVDEGVVRGDLGLDVGDLRLVRVLHLQLPRARTRMSNPCSLARAYHVGHSMCGRQTAGFIDDSAEAGILLGGDDSMGDNLRCSISDWSAAKGGSVPGPGLGSPARASGQDSDVTVIRTGRQL